MNMTKRIESLSDSKAVRACDYISNWLWSNQKAFEGLSERTTAEIMDDTIFIGLLNEIALEAGYEENIVLPAENKTKGAIARNFLLVLSENNSEKVEEALNCPTFKDPISTMLLYAGILLFLSTEIEYTNEIDDSGRRSRKIRIIKKAVTPSELTEFLGRVFGK